MKNLFKLIVSFFIFAGCGSENSSVDRAQKTADSVKKSTKGVVAPVVTKVRRMSNSTQVV